MEKQPLFLVEKVIYTCLVFRIYVMFWCVSKNRIC